MKKIIKEEILDEVNVYSIEKKGNALDELDYVITDECLHPKTLISTDNGNIEIQNIEVNDKVLTINEENNYYEYKSVKKIHKNLMISSNEKMYELEMENGSKIKITGNHEVLTEKNGWVQVDDLSIGDDIIDLESFIK